MLITYPYDWEPGPVEEAVDRFLSSPAYRKRHIYSIHRLEFSDMADLVQQLTEFANRGWKVVQVLTTESVAKGHGDAVVLFKDRYSDIVKA